MGHGVPRLAYISACQEHRATWKDTLWWVIWLVGWIGNYFYCKFAAFSSMHVCRITVRLGNVQKIQCIGVHALCTGRVAFCIGLPFLPLFPFGPAPCFA